MRIDKAREEEEKKKRKKRHSAGSIINSSTPHTDEVGVRVEGELLESSAILPDNLPGIYTPHLTIFLTARTVVSSTGI